MPLLEIRCCSILTFVLHQFLSFKNIHKFQTLSTRIDLLKTATVLGLQSDRLIPIVHEADNILKGELSF